MGVPAGRYVRVSVIDDGAGISAEERERILEPFFTSKSQGRSGTGLGLTVVWNTVHDHAGHIQVNSTPAQRFDLYFPMAASAAVASDHEAGEEPHGAGESVLAVDDEAEQRKLATRVLERLGYDVSQAESGEAALKHAEASAPDLVLLDMKLGAGIGGLETYQRLVAANPGQRAVLVTGFADPEDLRQARELGADQLLLKPFTFSQLAAVVREALTDEAKG